MQVLGFTCHPLHILYVDLHYFNGISHLLLWMKLKLSTAIQHYCTQKSHGVLVFLGAKGLRKYFPPLLTSTKMGGKNENGRVASPEIYINPIALKMAKTPSSFGHSECNRVNIHETSSRALDLRNLGPKFGPIPKAKKYVFFPILDEKFPIWQSVFGSGKYQV